MFGLGTIINTAAVIVGGIFGILFGKLLKERLQEGLQKACGLSVMFLAIAGVMEEMLSVSDGDIVSGHAMLVVICLVLGTLIGELIDIEKWLEKFGEWLKRKTGNAKDANFVNGFLVASLTTCVGAMTVIGSIEDGISGDYTILVSKSILDFIIVMVMASSMGKGPIFSAIPIFVCQGLITVLAVVLKPLLTDLSMSYLSMVGSVLIFGVGINLVFGKKVRVANMLPAIILAVLAAYL